MNPISPDLTTAGAEFASAVAKNAGQGLAVIFGDAASEVGQLLGDRVRFWRLQQLTAVIEQAQQIAARRGLKQEQLKALPFGDALRIADAVSREEQPEIQSLWARLIANVVSGATDGVERAYVDLLKSLSPDEASFLDILWDLRSIDQRWRYNKEAALQRDAIEAGASGQRWAGLTDDARHLAIQNLLRLRCITVPAPDVPAFLLTPDYFAIDSAHIRTETLDSRKVRDTLQELCRYASLTSGGTSLSRRSPHSRPEWESFELSQLGLALMRACAEGEVSEPPSKPEATLDV